MTDLQFGLGLDTTRMEQGAIRGRAAIESVAVAGEQSAMRFRRAWGAIPTYIVMRGAAQAASVIPRVAWEQVTKFNELMIKGFQSATDALVKFSSRFRSEFVKMGMNVERWRNLLAVAFRDLKTQQLAWGKSQEMFQLGRRIAIKTPFTIADIMNAIQLGGVAGIPVGTYLGTKQRPGPIIDMASMFMAQGRTLEDAVKMAIMARGGLFRRAIPYGISRQQFADWTQERGLGGIFEGAKGTGKIIDQPKFDVAFAQFLRDRFGGGAQLQMQTIIGIVSNIGDVWRNMLIEMVQDTTGAYEKLRTMLKGFLDWAWKAADSPEVKNIMQMINRAGAGALGLIEQGAQAGFQWFSGRFQENLRGGRPMDYLSALGRTGIEGVSALASGGLGYVSEGLAGKGPLAEPISMALELVQKAGDAMIEFLGDPRLEAALTDLLQRAFKIAIPILQEQMAQMMKIILSAGFKTFREQPGRVIRYGAMKATTSPTAWLMAAGTGLATGAKVGGFWGAVIGALTGLAAMVATGAAAYYWPSGKGAEEKQLGGRISGTGAVPIIAHGGEFMVNADATKRWLPLLKAINAPSFQGGGQVPRDALGRFTAQAFRWGIPPVDMAGHQWHELGGYKTLTGPGDTLGGYPLAQPPPAPPGRFANLLAKMRARWRAIPSGILPLIGNIVSMMTGPESEALKLWSGVGTRGWAAQFQTKEGRRAFGRAVSDYREASQRGLLGTLGGIASAVGGVPLPLLNQIIGKSLWGEQAGLPVGAVMPTRPLGGMGEIIPGTGWEQRHPRFGPLAEQDFAQILPPPSTPFFGWIRQLASERVPAHYLALQTAKGIADLRHPPFGETHDVHEPEYIADPRQWPTGYRVIDRIAGETYRYDPSVLPVSEGGEPGSPGAWLEQLAWQRRVPSRPTSPPFYGVGINPHPGRRGIGVLGIPPRHTTPGDSSMTGVP